MCLELKERERDRERKFGKTLINHSRRFYQRSNHFQAFNNILNNNKNNLNISKTKSKNNFFLFFLKSYTVPDNNA